MAALSGETRTGAQAVLMEGKPIGHLGARVRRNMGLAFIPEERLGRGAVPGLNLAQNTLLTAHRQGLVRYGLVRYQAARELAQTIISRFGVKCAGPLALARSLSGGNLQKFIVGREITQRPHILLVSQPTWGVDVGAAAQLRQTLIDLSREGVAILVVSEELEELFEICDRIAVITGGQLSPPQRREDTGAEPIGMLMAGRKTGETLVDHPTEMSPTCIS
jgi:simple sugar transport system ATP-binding protein